MKSLMDPIWNKAKAEIPWYDDPRAGLFIDDNSLYVLQKIGEGYFENASRSAYQMMVHSPFEWTHKETIQFLVQAADEYSLELSNFNLQMTLIREEYSISAIEKSGKVIEGYEVEVAKYLKQKEKAEEYRKKHDLTWGSLDKELRKLTPVLPTKPIGPYKWAIDYIHTQPEDDETSQLLVRVMSEQPFKRSDLDRMIEESHRHIAPSTNPNYEPLQRKNFFNALLEWVTFNVSSSPKLAQDLTKYLVLFEQDKLKPNRSSKFMAYKHWSINPNLFTFARHQQLLLDELSKMENDYGSSFLMNNRFDDAVPFEDEEENIQERYATRQFLFMHVLFAFQHLGYLTIEQTYNNWDKHKEPRRYFARVKLLPPIYKLLGKDTDPSVSSSENKMNFHEDTSTLSIAGKSVIIAPGRNTQQHYLMIELMKKPDKLFDVDRVWKKLTGSEYDPARDWKKIHSTASAINAKVAVATNSRDFIKVTKTSLQISKNYLS